jgi:hypothetical protein
MSAQLDFPGRGNSEGAINNHGNGANPYVDGCQDLEIYTNGTPPTDPASFVDFVVY